MKKVKSLVIALGIALGLSAVSYPGFASIGSKIGGAIDCPYQGIPCSSDADSTQTQRCKFSFSLSLTGPSVTCSE